MVCFCGVLTFFEINVDWSFVFAAGKSDTNNISFMLQLSCNGYKGPLTDIIQRTKMLTLIQIYYISYHG